MSFLSHGFALILVLSSRSQLTRLYRSAPIGECGYDMQAALQSHPLFVPEPAYTPPCQWIHSNGRFDITCGTTIPSASVDGVFSHLMQCHSDDPYLPVFHPNDGAPSQCAWAHCSEARESVRALCEHIVAQHINPCESEGRINSDLMCGQHAPATTGTQDCRMLYGAPLQQGGVGELEGVLFYRDTLADFSESRTCLRGV